MGRRRFTALFLFLSFCSISPAQNLLSNGDFEGDFGGWTQVETAEISTSIVHSGSKSLTAIDENRANCSYVYREFVLDYGRHEITFWVYPASEVYYSAFELISNWQPGPATFITRILLRETGTSFTAVDASAAGPTLTQNTWNKIVIQIERASLTQEFFINDNLVASLTSGSFPATEHLLVGDLSAAGMYGTVYFDDISIVERPVTSVPESLVPSKFSLEQNFPNPFNPDTEIRFGLPVASEVSIHIYNILGRKVKSLGGQQLQAGFHSLSWDGTGTGGHQVPSGIYFYLIGTGKFSQAKKMSLIR